MRKTFTIIGALCLALLILMAGCYQPGGPIPEDTKPPAPRDYTQEDVDRVVTMEEQVISAPLPAEWGAPASCDEIHFLRFRPRDNSTLVRGNRTIANPETTDAMLLMLPGIFEGANGFEYLARQLIYQAKVKDHKNYEVWAVERRNNRLEDLTGMNYIEDQINKGNVDMEEAVDAYVSYYYKGEPINGKTFDGWLWNQDLPFLSEFGLKLDTEDVFKVIQTMVPDPAVRRKKVFVGGHSMGGPMAAYFVGWDLDGNPATTNDAGYNNCAGMFGFDTSLAPMDGAAPWMPATNTTESDYVNYITTLRDGSNPVVTNTSPFLGAESMASLESIAMAAYYDPDAEDTYIREVPVSEDINWLNRLMFSKDLDTFVQATPTINDFRLTNEALLGMFFDDNFVPTGMVQNSMGFVKGGPVTPKDFPIAMANMIPGMSAMLGTGDYFIPNDAGPADDLGTGPLYSWANFDEIGDASDPNYTDTTGTTTYTTMETEVSDIRDVSRAIFKGPLNLVEWYFSTRLLFDLNAVTQTFGPKYDLNYLYGDKLSSMPQVLFLAGEGMNGGATPGPGLYVCKGYNHLDVLMACANASSRRPSEVIGPLIDFLKTNAK
jgi:pimeloyl-ACP methyl ester carboxylesterase